MPAPGPTGYGSCRVGAHPAVALRQRERYRIGRAGRRAESGQRAGRPGALREKRRYSTQQPSARARPAVCRPLCRGYSSAPCMWAARAIVAVTGFRCWSGNGLPACTRSGMLTCCVSRVISVGSLGPPPAWPQCSRNSAPAADRPLDWAAESQALRPRVYAFDRNGKGPFPLPPGYLDGAGTGGRAIAACRCPACRASQCGIRSRAGCAGEVASR